MVQIEYRRASDNSLLSRFVYSYDAAGNKVQVQEEVLQPDGSWSVATVSYGYDQIDRLVSEKRTGSHPYWYDYGYDGSGNRLVMVQRDGSGNIVGQKSYNYDGGNKLLQEVANGVTTVYQYDPNGNTISKTTGTSQVRYYWDDEDKMVRVEDSVVMNFKTDGLGFRRMKEVVGQGQTWFVYDLGKSETPGLAPLVAEYDQNGNLVAKYHHDGGGLMAMTRNNASYWYAFEAIGTARQLMDSQSQVSDAYAFDAWGNDLTSPQSQVPNPFRYVGKYGYYLDTESLLMLLGMRYYVAHYARFLNIDPLKHDLNWFIYTANRPIVYIDPSGLQYECHIDIKDPWCRYESEHIKAYRKCYIKCLFRRSDNFYNCMAKCMLEELGEKLKDTVCYILTCVLFGGRNPCEDPNKDKTFLDCHGCCCFEAYQCLCNAIIESILESDGKDKNKISVPGYELLKCFGRYRMCSLKKCCKHGDPGYDIR
ncbi:RHS repeat-associated core domain-containing protein [Fervidibacter sacchari]|uniref:RHS repeat-associated protein n=1 Tax=Candidatus Fervidibacter sacchari TaxID=1448929 RepID=A0ABT2EK11_9BACT|nr:RHS repeat-associated core domain-containing protein [Candidatus Fervidibacter sacchari]MCS3918024.1 RHS repeat-associated protein [Candidatus Fervidibacter sacchari]WKU15837.1 RHS repeat-associated core domain-containing protein [Candidatus Fervidibacter sacchari]